MCVWHGCRDNLWQWSSRDSNSKLRIRFFNFVRTDGLHIIKMAFTLQTIQKENQEESKWYEMETSVRGKLYLLNQYIAVPCLSAYWVLRHHHRNPDINNKDHLVGDYYWINILNKLAKLRRCISRVHFAKIQSNSKLVLNPPKSGKQKSQILTLINLLISEFLKRGQYICCQ